jgi:dienelactone hydrolase
MKKSLGFLAVGLSLLAIGAVFLPEPPPAEPKWEELKAKAKAFVEQLAKDDFEAAVKDFDTVMAKVQPPDKLGETWKGFVEKIGAFKKQKSMRTERIGKYAIVYVACEFAKAPFDIKVVFNGDQQISGMFFTPPKDSAGDYQAPPYVRKGSFMEKEVKVGSGEWVLPGTLTMPNGAGPFRAVVLVHGSGPQDRDESIGPNRFFRDLAWGLGSRGIAVLRYEKRTKEHAAKMAAVKDTLTLKEEVTDDALAAVALLRKTEGIDAQHIFVLGHSLGAMLAPRIGVLDPEVAGLIAMAGTTRPFADILVEQLDYVLSLSDDAPEEAKKQLQKIRDQAAALQKAKVTKDTPASEFPFGMTAVNWLSIQECHPAEEAAKVKQPMLVLQGERDYQATMEDFQGWKKALAARENVVFKSYPRLNHLFMGGMGKAKPAEYEKPAHVAADVIQDIGEWIEKQ